ncbi:MAG: gamma-glutamyltransferase [Candidatus Nanopelagicales bacterium]
MGSLMKPTLLEGSDGSRTVLGTGGSERIRSAVLGVVLRLVDEGAAGLADAVSRAARPIGSDHQVHVEPGLPEAALAQLDRLAGSGAGPASSSGRRRTCTSAVCTPSAVPATGRSPPWATRAPRRRPPPSCRLVET